MATEEVEANLNGKAVGGTSGLVLSWLESELENWTIEGSNWSKRSGLVRH